MVFYYFGPDQSSWALGNDEFALANNLPESIQAVWDRLAEPFEDKQMAGTLIQWISTSTSGSYAIMAKNGDLLSNCDELRTTIAEQLQNAPGTSVEHISFSPLGGWFIRYNDGTAQLSGRFPDTFYAIANRYLDLTIQSRQTSQVDGVLFGNGNSIVVKAGSALHWDGISQALTNSLNSLTPDGIVTLSFTSGPNTVLCPWSDEYYFIEAIPLLPGATQYAYELPTAEVSTELLKHLAANTRPPEHLIPSVSRLHAPLPEPRQPPSSSALPSSAPPAGDGPASLLPPSVPANMRSRYEQQFVVHSTGTDHLNGPEAARILLNTGLDREALFELWELVDKEKSGTLDMEEFVQAMWQTDLRRTGTNIAIRWAEAPLSCDGCSRGLVIGEDTYFCTICEGGDFDLCLACYADEAKRCQHDLSRVTIQLPNHVLPRLLPGNYAICDGCGTHLEDGVIVYCCSICNGGDYDICEACWEVRRTCSHLLSLYKLQAASTESTLPVAPDTHQAPLPSTQGMPAETPTFRQEPTRQPASEMDQLGKQLMDSSLEDSLLSCIVSEKPNVKWEDVVGLETAKAELQEAIIFPTRFPQIFRGTRQARRAVLLHGPSGTGKSYLAKAAATEAGLALFSVRCGDVGAKRMGQGENLMGQLFTLAREKKPSIVFIDELDTVCGKQDSKDANGETSTRIRTEFLVQMEANNNDGVFVLAATNRPWSLDPAVQRRFQKRLHRCVHVPLPDEEARSKLFKFHLGDTASSLDNAEEAFRDLAQKTAGFSSRDISDLVQAALMTPVKKVHAATYFRKASPPILQQNNMLTRPLQFRDRHGEWYTPCNPFEDGATLMKWDKVPARQLKEPTLTLADLYNAVAKARPSVGEEEVRKCSEWTRQYAMESA